MEVINGPYHGLPSRSTLVPGQCIVVWKTYNPGATGTPSGGIQADALEARGTSSSSHVGCPTAATCHALYSLAWTLLFHALCVFSDFAWFFLCFHEKTFSLSREAEAYRVKSTIMLHGESELCFPKGKKKAQFVLHVKHTNASHICAPWKVKSTIMLYRKRKAQLCFMVNHNRASWKLKEAQLCLSKKLESIVVLATKVEKHRCASWKLKNA